MKNLTSFLFTHSEIVSQIISNSSVTPCSPNQWSNQYLKLNLFYSGSPRVNYKTVWLSKRVCSHTVYETDVESECENWTLCKIARNLNSFYWPQGGNSSTFEKEVQLYGSLQENDPSSLLPSSLSSFAHCQIVKCTCIAFKLTSN